MEVKYILGRHNFCSFEKDHQPDLKITPAAFAVELLQQELIKSRDYSVF